MAQNTIDILMQVTSHLFMVIVGFMLCIIHQLAGSNKETQQIIHEINTEVPTERDIELFSGPASQNFDTAISFYKQFSLHAKYTFLYRFSKALSKAEAKKLIAYIRIHHDTRN